MDDYLNLFVEETSWYNDIVLGAILPDKWRLLLPHFLRSWLRNYIGINVLYFLSGTLWCLVIYYWKRNLYIPEVCLKLFPCYWGALLLIFGDSIPSRQSVLLQIFAAMKAMPWFSAIPTISEYMVEHGWTRCFSRISDVGWLAYVFYLFIYLVLVEFCVYWVHRALHKKFLYKHLHYTHHMYNKANSLSPFAALAFNPLDGILQGMPHVVALFLAPMHLTSHIALLFIDGIWAVNIHDCIHGKLWPFMGAGYHAIHHTTYAHNYGHFTVWMDWMLGTLRDPEEDDAKKKI